MSIKGRRGAACTKELGEKQGRRLELVNGLGIEDIFLEMRRAWRQSDSARGDSHGCPIDPVIRDARGRHGPG